jgi:hypothetical protein
MQISLRFVLALCSVIGVLFSFFPHSRNKIFNLSPASQGDAESERGKFVLHKFAQPIGEETYEIIRDGKSVAVKIDFKFTDRGSPVPMTASFRGGDDLTPEAFEIKGKNSRLSAIDEAVDVESQKIRTRDQQKWSEGPRPKQFFTIAGYAPATMQMLMFRYWMTHGSPVELQTLPNGRVQIESRGQDTVNVSGKDEMLDRYTVEGLIWGRETLWFDSHRNLVAEVSTDAEFDHFEAIREGYEPALGIFLARSGSDGMAALADLAKRISGSRADSLAILGGTLIDGTGSGPITDAAVVVERDALSLLGRAQRQKFRTARPRWTRVADISSQACGTCTRISSRLSGALSTLLPGLRRYAIAATSSSSSRLFATLSPAVEVSVRSFC